MVPWFISGFNSMYWAKIWIALHGMTATVEQRIDDGIMRDLANYEAVLHEVFTKALHSNCPKQMHAALGKIKAKPKRKGKRVQNLDGDPTFNDREERIAFLRQFASQLNGTLTTFAEVIKTERARVLAQIGEPRVIELCLAAIPSIIETTRLTFSHNRQSAVAGIRGVLCSSARSCAATTPFAL